MPLALLADGSLLGTLWRSGDILTIENQPGPDCMAMGGHDPRHEKGHRFRDPYIISTGKEIAIISDSPANFSRTLFDMNSGFYAPVRVSGLARPWRPAVDTSFECHENNETKWLPVPRQPGA